MNRPPSLAIEQKTTLPSGAIRYQNSCSIYAAWVELHKLHILQWQPSSRCHRKSVPGRRVRGGGQRRRPRPYPPVASIVLRANSRCNVPVSISRAVMPIHFLSCIIKSKANHSMWNWQSCFSAWPYRVCNMEWPVLSATQAVRDAWPPVPQSRLCPPSGLWYMRPSSVRLNGIPYSSSSRGWLSALLGTCNGWRHGPRASQSP